ncbi:unnamed protein product [Tilletia controversa]|uniref:DUF3533 domain-containing protein n=3 Tax=Tilletia TaxID=13289 RepID=A0A8X7MX15_9BASI|nr:hypothetical protein CF336_g2871 [Tilletia laevis]KAE8200703.1 hypothetical protein CF328_g2892 [Tilletia controversa]KAE8262441.1 hypothetical protein A4X03_0g2450 [Tilletia caries]KAE8205680.1 hypothetical protein CF335_g2217 [Tilletia laevis]KAE8253014.1 hypothetical protein A4X06_0g1766 [Tilletia controversa]
MSTTQQRRSHPFVASVANNSGSCPAPGSVREVPQQHSTDTFRLGNSSSSERTVSVNEWNREDAMAPTSSQVPRLSRSPPAKSRGLDNAKDDGDAIRPIGSESAPPVPKENDVDGGGGLEFWAPQLATLRKEYLIGLVRLCGLLTLLIWGVLAIYWGGLWRASSELPNLTAFLIDRDTPGGVIGNTTRNALFGSMHSSPSHLNWKLIDPTTYPDPASIEQAIAADEKAWIAVEVSQDVSLRLAVARASGDASWNPHETVTMYFSEARANTAIPGMVVAPTQRILEAAFAEMTISLAQQYLRSITANTSALEAIERAPQTLVTPVILTPQNLRVWDQTVATAPTFVGLIYVVIIALNVALGNFGMRQEIQSKLKISSLIAMRLVIPIVVYLFLSFQYAMLNLPFRLHFDGWHLGFGAGFLTFVAATWCGMITLGLIIECVLTLIGPALVGLFLILLIISNVVTVVYPIPLMPAFFRYGYAMPFFHLRSIYVHVVFNAGKHILVLYHFGVLFAWIAVLLATYPLWIVLERRRGAKAREKAEMRVDDLRPHPSRPPTTASEEKGYAQEREKAQVKSSSTFRS